VPDGGADLRRVARVSPAGQVTTAYTPPDQPTDLVVAADGTLYVAYNAGTPTLVRVPPGGGAVTLLTDPGGDNTHDLRLALGADGKVWISGNGKLRTWTAAAGVQPVRSDPRFDNTADMAVDDGLSAPAGLAFGANGDLYFADSGHKQVKRIPANEL
jgi:sugar lactone lactonase YvrE